MIELTPVESRVLGVLVEKALTTPEQYPLTLNSVVAGANQKNNRDPVLNLSEDECFEALEGLRGKGLVVRVDQVGARVPKFRHQAGEVLHARTGELAILAELLVRGPQTLGELRGRASRMHPMATMEDAKGMVRALMDRPEPLVRELAPEPGSWAERYAQLLCPELHPVGAPTFESVNASGDAGGSLADRVTKLEAEVQTLRETVERLTRELGVGATPGGTK